MWLIVGFDFIPLIHVVFLRVYFIEILYAFNDVWVQVIDDSSLKLFLFQYESANHGCVKETEVSYFLCLNVQYLNLQDIFKVLVGDEP
jgi:hypothetical protein